MAFLHLSEKALDKIKEILEGDLMEAKRKVLVITIDPRIDERRAAAAAATAIRVIGLGRGGPRGYG
jgi:hypothetical protein